jgi:hypothetical protein
MIIKWTRNDFCDVFSHNDICTLNTYHWECSTIYLYNSLVNVKNNYGILDNVEVWFNDISLNEVLLQRIYTL